MSKSVSFRLQVATERWPLKTPFRITGHTWEALEVLVVTLEAEGAVGRREAAGVCYRSETADTIGRLIEMVRGAVESGDLTTISL